MIINTTPHAIVIVDDDGQIIRSWPAAEVPLRLRESGVRQP